MGGDPPIAGQGPIVVGGYGAKSHRFSRWFDDNC
jgi:hypothetical protein